MRNSAMDAVETMLAEHGCVSVCTRFYHHLDRREFKALASLMAEDGVWLRQGKGVTGPQAVLDSLMVGSPDRKTRHLLSNVVVTLLDGGSTARVAYDLAIFIQEGESAGEALRYIHRRGPPRARWLDMADSSKGSRCAVPSRRLTSRYPASNDNDNGEGSAMTMAMSPESGMSFLDNRPMSGLQIRTLILCALVGMLDGNDTQVMGIAAPSIAAALHVPPSAMGWAISGSWVGAAIGAVVLGAIADRAGRKPVLVAAVLAFGLFTLLTPLADNLPLLVAFRVLAGIGLGGATPCFLSLASEYTPARWRASIVSLVWAAFPLGILIGGLSNGWMLSRLSWHFAFYAGGVTPLVMALLLLTLLPESIGFLLLRRPGDRRVARILAAIAPGLPLETAGTTATGPVAKQGH